ncbi:MAG: PAS domain-containing protein [Candidatus Margulisbacteria bacterium]|nr:PAS domain-containing protein [Candidatus Margulisiibacteriota bacterium]
MNNETNKFKNASVIRGLLFLFFNILFIIFTTWIFPHAQIGAGVLCIIPVVFGGWLLGITGGVVTALFFIPFVTDIFHSGHPDVPVSAAIVRIIVLIAVGVTVGWLRKITIEQNKLLSQNKKSQEKLIEALKISENRFRKMFNCMIEGVIIYKVIFNKQKKPEDYMVIDINEACLELLNIKKESVMGKRISELYNIEKPDYVNTFDEVVNSGNPKKYELYLEEQKKYFNGNVFTLGDGWLVSILEDITGLKEIEKNLIEANNRYKYFMKIMENEKFFYMRKPTGPLLEVSSSVKNLLGYNNNEFLKNFRRYLILDKQGKNFLHHDESYYDRKPSYKFNLSFLSKKSEAVNFNIEEIKIEGQSDEILLIGIATLIPDNAI